jgi:hypothetical protein
MAPPTGPTASAGYDALDARVRAVERMVALFQLERMFHLIVTGCSLVMLLTSAGVLLYRNNADPATLTMLFGSSGLITYATGRLLRMWDQALALLSGQTQKEGSNG